MALWRLRLKPDGPVAASSGSTGLRDGPRGLVAVPTHAAKIFVAVQACAIAVDFGTPVGIVLAIVGIWTMGMRYQMGRGSVSPYCNKDRKAILGGFTAEQFDAQMRHKDVDDVDDADAGGGAGHLRNDGRRLGDVLARPSEANLILTEEARPKKARRGARARRPARTPNYRLHLRVNKAGGGALMIGV